MKNISFVLFYLWSISVVYAQIGINSEPPFGAFLEVKTEVGTSNSISVVNSNNEALLTLTNTGLMGAGIIPANADVKLDLRASNKNVGGGLAIGEVNYTPQEAQKGAVRIDKVKNILQYSDGTRWVTLGTKPKKVLIKANKTVQQNIAHATKIYMTNWQNSLVVNDGDPAVPGSGWNAATGKFKVPRSGVYCIFTDFTFQANNITAPGSLEVSHIVDDKVDASVMIPFSTNKSLVNIVSSLGSLHYFAAGQIVAVMIYQETGSTQVNSSNATLNSLIIAEL